MREYVFEQPQVVETNTCPAGVYFAHIHSCDDNYDRVVDVPSFEGTFTFSTDRHPTRRTMWFNFNIMADKEYNKLAGRYNFVKCFIGDLASTIPSERDRAVAFLGSLRQAVLGRELQGEERVKFNEKHLEELKDNVLIVNVITDHTNRPQVNQVKKVDSTIEAEVLALFAGGDDE